MLFGELKDRIARDNPVAVGLVGAGAMGKGIALQVARTPGMQLTLIADLSLSVAEEAARAAGLRPVHDASEIGPGSVLVSDDCLAAVSGDAPMEVLAEATNSICPAAEYALAAFARGAHVVLMNAEVDLALGRLLAAEARKAGVVVTSDAGDQHGVLMQMIEEIQFWGFDIVQAGNIKGFHDVRATAEGLAHEAAIRNLDPVQCCAYTDGTKLNIEMALIANVLGLRLNQRGMIGPKASHVTEVFDLFDFATHPPEGAVDYILGAEPGGGVYVVGHCDDPVQQGYMTYYKMGDGPDHLFYRPYHLCHIETPLAIARAALRKEALIEPTANPTCDVYAFAKTDLPAGADLGHAIGGDAIYGLIEEVEVAEEQGLVPITWLEGQGGVDAVVTEAVAQDAPLRVSEVMVPPGKYYELLQRQGGAQIGSLRVLDPVPS